MQTGFGIQPLGCLSLHDDSTLKGEFQLPNKHHFSNNTRSRLIYKIDGYIIEL